MKRTYMLFFVGLCIATVAYFLLIRRYVPEIHPVASAGIAVLGGASMPALFGAISKLVQSLSDKMVLARC
jgi:hypothetical protein